MIPPITFAKEPVIPKSAAMAVNVPIENLMIDPNKIRMDDKTFSMIQLRVQVFGLQV
jgi:hypothetical protein